ncbi:MAG: molybdopterin-dependent oxidoreductase, partial [Parachlamydiaceae bacterium]|nr:molybdopterin-dependent oxidoreductase [Parachlamydiaceae bacterium]
YALEISLKLSQTLLHPPGEELEMIENLFKSLDQHSTSKGALLIGGQYLNGPHRLAVLEKCLKFKETHPQFSINIMEGKDNSLGAYFAGMRPDLGPNNEKIERSFVGKNVSEVINTTMTEGWDVLYVAGANPSVKVPSDIWKKIRSKTKFIVVQDLFLNETAQDADVVLPTLCYVEKHGTFINIDGHIQRLQPGKDLLKGVFSDAEIFARLAEKLGISLNIGSNFFKKLEGQRLSFSRTNSIQNVENKNIEALIGGEFYATFAPSLFDHGVRMRHNPHLYQLCKPPVFRIHPFDAEKAEIKNNETIKLRIQDSTITGHVQFDSRVAKKTIVLPLGFPEIPVHNLGINLWNGMQITYDR